MRSILVPSLWEIVLCGLFFLPTFRAASRNITVDDSSPRIIFAPSTAWLAEPQPSPFDLLPPCANCTRPLQDLAFNKTWHAAVQWDIGKVSANLTFHGTAIYVYSIIANSKLSTYSTSLFFTLDGVQAGSFSWLAQGQDEYRYNVPVFQAVNLSDNTHTMTISQANGSIFFLDYIMYTETAGDPSIEDSILMSESKKRHDAATFGGAVGGVLGTLMILSVWLCYDIRRRRQISALRNAETSDIQDLGNAENPLHASGVPAMSEAITIRSSSAFMGQHYPSRDYHQPLTSEQDEENPVHPPGLGSCETPPPFSNHIPVIEPYSSSRPPTPSSPPAYSHAILNM